MSDFILTPENYYSTDANTAYVSVTQYKDFIGTPGQLGCEAAALARSRGDYTEPETTSLLVGSYVDHYFDGTLENFIAEHPEIVSSRGSSAGELKSEYRQAEVMIQKAVNDKMFMRYMAGDKQVVMTGEIEGVPVKVKLDSTDGIRISDLKTVKSITDTYYVRETGERVSFIEWWGYDIQGAVYREIYRQNTGDTLPFYICAVSKDKSGSVCHPRIAVIEISPVAMDKALENVRENITRVQDLKQGVYEPVRCGICDFCADTEILSKPISSDDLLSNT